MIETALDRALARRRQLRPIYRAAAEARISADWARRAEDCRRMFNLGDTE